MRGIVRPSCSVKVVCLVSSPGGGGAERAAANLCRFLARRGHDIAVTSLYDRDGYDFGAPIHRPAARWAPPRSILQKPLRLAQKVSRITCSLSELKPDIVMSFGDGPNFAALAARPLLGRVPMVINQQVAPLRAYDGLERSIYRQLTLRLYPRADAVVALSSGVADALRSLVGRRLPEPTVIHNSVDCTQIQRECAEQSLHEALPPKKRPVVLSVGRLDPQKDHMTLLRAVSALPDDERPDVWIVGEGPLRAGIQSLVGELGLTESVHLLGWRRDVFAVMQEADIFVLSSRYEGFANVVVEALACNLPVIATDCPYGPSEILDGGRYGMLVPLADACALTESLKLLLADGERRAALAAAGPDRAAQFDISVVGEHYERLLEEVATRSSPALPR